MTRTREATLADLPALAALFDAYRQFYAQAADLPTATAFIEARLTQRDAVLLITEGGAGQALGFAQLYPTFCSISAQPIYTLSDLFVWPAARRTGAGRALLQAAEAVAAQRGRVRLELTTARSNTVAQAAYVAQGWVRDEVYLTYTREVTPRG